MATAHTFSGVDGYRRVASLIGLSAEETAAREEALQASYMPFKVTRFYAELIASLPEPERTQLLNVIVPPVGARPFVGRFDPYGNASYRAKDQPFIQHKYEKTLLLHIDDYCIANCQFCYKVREIRTTHTSALSFEDKITAASSYLENHPEIDNVLFTGGDPAAFRRTDQLVSLIDKLLSRKSIRIVRFATKGLAYDPERFMDSELLEFFRRIGQRYDQQVSVIAQINHPAEITPQAATALRALADLRVQVRGQPAIASGINDSVDTLTRLQRLYIDHRVVPYYFTIFMPVRGVEQYALSLDAAVLLMDASRRQLNGLEKKCVLLASHDFGKIEVVGFAPSVEEPASIVLRWHQAAMARYLPTALVAAIPTRPHDIVILEFRPNVTFNVDQLFAYNGLPHFDEEGRFVDSQIALRRGAVATTTSA